MQNFSSLGEKGSLNKSKVLKNKGNKDRISGHLIVIKSNAMGNGSDELGNILMQSFINVLPDAGSLPERIIFYNGGIHYAVKGSAVLQGLKRLEKKGVMIQSCGTCLNFFNKKDDLAVGTITNMYDIIENLVAYEHVIYP